MNTKIYQLYHNKEKATIRVTPMSKMFYHKTYVDQLIASATEEIVYYNSNYFFSLSRKALVQKAREMKEEWIKELEVKLEMYKSIKI